MYIIIASTNPVKRNAALFAFQAIFPTEKITIDSINAPSEVKDQPMSEAETLLGAQNRVKNARKKIATADYYVGIEGGVEIKQGEMEAFAWVVIQSKTNKSGKGRTGSFFLPKKIIKLIEEGTELGVADDIVFNHSNSKQKMGTVGILTKNVCDRTEYYKQAVILALIPFINPEMY